MHKGIHTIMIYMTDNDVGNTFRWQSEKKKGHFSLSSTLKYFKIPSFFTLPHTQRTVCAIKDGLVM